MSIEILEDDVIRKHVSGNGGSGSSVHEHAASQLLYPTRINDTGKKDENGEPIYETVIDVDGRTELPAPANTTVLEYYAGYLDKVFGKGKGNGMRHVNERYKINMTSKNRKGRTEFTMVATATALNPEQDNGKNLLKQVQNQ